MTDSAPGQRMTTGASVRMGRSGWYAEALRDAAAVRLVTLVRVSSSGVEVRPGALVVAHDPHIELLGSASAMSSLITFSGSSQVW